MRTTSALVKGAPSMGFCAEATDFAFDDLAWNQPRHHRIAVLSEGDASVQHPRVQARKLVLRIISSGSVTSR